MSLMLGDVFLAGTWPPWEIRGQPCEHPCMVIKKGPVPDRWLVAPISHSKDLHRVVIRIFTDHQLVCRPVGPIKPKPDESWLCLKDHHGDTVPAWIDAADRAIVFPAVVPRSVRIYQHIHPPSGFVDEILTAIRMAVR